MCLPSLSLWAETRAYQLRRRRSGDTEQLVEPVPPVVPVEPVPAARMSDSAQVVVERSSGEPLVGLDVPASRLLDDVRR